MSNKSMWRKSALALICALSMSFALPFMAGATVVIGGSDDNDSSSSDTTTPQIEEIDPTTFEEEVEVTNENSIVPENDVIDESEVIAPEDDTMVDEGGYFEDETNVDYTGDDVGVTEGTVVPEDAGDDIASTSTNVHGMVLVAAILAAGVAAVMVGKKRSASK